MSKTLLGILVFSLVETVAVIVWIVLAGFKTEANLNTQIVAGVVLFAFYVVEHVIALNVGKGRPFFDVEVLKGK